MKKQMIRWINVGKIKVKLFKNPHKLLEGQFDWKERIVYLET
jgi:hypothetical protein